MNRRNFLAGLLATTAAVPLAKAGFAADMGVEPVAVGAFEFAGESSGITYIWHRSAIGFAVTAERISPEFMREFTRWGPEPGTVWYDEAADLDETRFQIAVDYARDILDRQPIDESQLTGYVDADGFHPRRDIAMLPPSVEAKPHDESDDGA